LDNTQSYGAEFGIQQIDQLCNLFQILNFFCYLLNFFVFGKERAVTQTSFKMKDRSSSCCMLLLEPFMGVFSFGSIVKVLLKASDLLRKWVGTT